MESNVELSYERGEKAFRYPNDGNHKSGYGGQKNFEPVEEVSRKFSHIVILLKCLKFNM